MTSTPMSDPADSRVVLLGVHTFAHLEDLPAVASNVRALDGLFKDPEVWGLPPQNSVVIDQNSSSIEVLEKLEDAARQASDTLVFYYAGHGLIDPVSEELCLALATSREDWMHSTLRYEYVRRIIASPRYPARRKVIIIDCCWSGRALVGMMGAGADLASQAAVEGTCVLTATAETKPALAPPGEEFTAFSGEMVSILRDGIEGAPELIDVETLYREVRSRLVGKSRPVPQIRTRNFAGKICIARNRAYADAAPKADAGIGIADVPSTHAWYLRTEPQSPGDAVPGTPAVLEALTVQAQMADYVARNGSAADAARSYAALVRRSTEQLGAGHPYTLQLRQDYANQIGLSGDPESAERLYGIIAGDCLRHLGPAHATTAAAHQGRRYWQRTAQESPVVYPRVAAPQTPSSTWPTLDALPPSAAGQLTAQFSQQSTYIEFENASDVVLNVCWIDFSGQPQLYKVLGPGQKYVQQTYVGHPWASIEPDGTVHAVFEPSETPARAVLR